MSKFLKFIVHTIVICTMLLVLAITLPPIWGIKTVVVTDSEKVTNLPLGSITYAIPVKTEEVGMGTKILVQNNSKTYSYNIASMDYANHIGTVIDPTVPGAETLTVAVKDYVPKVVITIGYLGYLQIATQSMEGWIVIVLGVLFLFILFIIAILWERNPEEDEEPEGTYIKSEKELRREEKAREKRMKEEDKELLRDAKRRKKEEKKKRKIVKTGGFVDEIYEDEDDEDYEYEEEPRANVQVATSEAHELLKKEIAAATAEEPAPVQPEPVREVVKAITEEIPAVEEIPEEAAEPEKPVEIKKMAIPVWSAAQLADRAKREGDAPDIVRDSVTKVTLFDYSDIIGGGDEEE